MAGVMRPRWPDIRVFAMSLPFAVLSGLAVWRMQDPVWLIPALVAVAFIHLSLLVASSWPWFTFGAVCVGALMLIAGPPVSPAASGLPGAVSAVLLPSTWMIAVGIYAVARWAVTYRWVAVLLGLAAVAEVTSALWDGVPWLLQPTMPEAWRAMVAALGVLAVGFAFALGRWHSYARTRPAPVEATPAWDPSAAIPGDLEWAVARQQARMAREVQEAVAGHLEVILSRAREGRNGYRRAPALAADALADISQQGEEALGRVQSLLALLTVTEGPHTDTADLEDIAASDAEIVLAPDDPWAPQPQLADLPRLIDAARGAGVPTTLTVEGERGDLPVAAQLALYRTVQESLTNTARHAGAGATALVELRWGTDDVTATVVDEVSSVPAPTGDFVDDLIDPGDYVEGKGLRTVRERLEALGGHLEVEQLADGYRVSGAVPRTPGSTFA